MNNLILSFDYHTLCFNPEYFSTYKHPAPRQIMYTGFTGSYMHFIFPFFAPSFANLKIIDATAHVL